MVHFGGRRGHYAAMQLRAAFRTLMAWLCLPALAILLRDGGVVPAPAAVRPWLDRLLVCRRDLEARWRPRGDAETPSS